MKRETKIIIILSVICIILCGIGIFGLFNRQGIMREHDRLLNLNSTINRELVFIREGQKRQSEELRQLRERERNRLDRERRIEEREERLNSRERERIDRDRESIRDIRGYEDQGRESIDRIREAAENIRKIIEAVMDN